MVATHIDASSEKEADFDEWAADRKAKKKSDKKRGEDGDAKKS